MTEATAAGSSLRGVVEKCAAATRRLALLSGGQRAQVLRDIAESIRSSRGRILDANAQDLQRASGLTTAMLDRLRLDDARVEGMALAVDSIAGQADPVGRVVEGRMLSNGIYLEQRRVPIGVILIIYESRPNVTADAAALCLKSGNGAILKGGREALASNRAIIECMQGPVGDHGLQGVIGFIESTDRASVGELLAMDDLIDLAIPRGGPGLMRAVVEQAHMPVIKHDAGVCHVYIDDSLDDLAEAAIEIVVNAKTQRPGVCNAIETLLVHEAQAEGMLPRIARALTERGVEIRADDRARSIVPGCTPASEDDWATEYLDLILAVRVVKSLEDACDHIRQYGSGHTDAIVTSSISTAQQFVERVDSASVMVNCSTRFADGGEYGLGAEIGISTEKLHARGPMGAEHLTTYKWVLTGRGQIRT